MDKTDQALQPTAMNKLLAICIPTFNRASILDETLRQLISQAEPYRIPIYISDNVSTDDTPLVVAQWQKRYPFLFYQRHTVMVNNVPEALRMTRSDYAWLMGDRCRLLDGAITTLLSIIDAHDHALIVVNAQMKMTESGYMWQRKHYAKRVDGIPEAVYSDRNQLLADLGWHMTLVGSTIFRSSVIEQGNFDKYYDTKFVHFLTAFDYLARRNFTAYWCDNALSYTAPGGASGWLHDTYETWISLWVEAVNGLSDSYTASAKQTCIKAACMKSGLFSIKGFSFLRGHNIYNMPVFRKYSPVFRLVTDVPRAVLFLIALIPAPFFLFIETMIRVVVPDLVRIPPKKP
jgi:abequosyltransferase